MPKSVKGVKLATWSDWLLLLAPVWSNYVLYGRLSVGDGLVGVWFLMRTFGEGDGRNAVRQVLFFLCWALLSYLFILSDGVYVGYYRAVVYVGLVVFSLRLGRWQKGDVFFPIYARLGGFFAISVLIQWVIWYLFAVRLSLQLPIEYYEIDTLKIINNGFRTGGWFKEPSYLAIFLTPLIFYLITKRKLFITFNVLLGGIASTSSLFVGAAVGAIILNWKTRRVLKFGVLIILTGLIFIATFPSVLNGYIFQRVEDIFINGGTLNIRLFDAARELWEKGAILPGGLLYKTYIEAAATGSDWYNSAVMLTAYFGGLGLIGLFLYFLKIGWYGLILIGLTITTNALNQPAGVLLAYGFSRLYYMRHSLERDGCVYKGN